MLIMIREDYGDKHFYAIYIMHGNGFNDHKFTGYYADSRETASALIQLMKAL